MAVRVTCKALSLSISLSLYLSISRSLVLALSLSLFPLLPSLLSPLLSSLSLLFSLTVTYANGGSNACERGMSCSVLPSLTYACKRGKVMHANGGSHACKRGKCSVPTYANGGCMQTGEIMHADGGSNDWFSLCLSLSLCVYVSLYRSTIQCGLFINETNRKTMDSTPHCSRVVPHPSTKRAQTALTSLFG